MKSLWWLQCICQRSQLETAKENEKTIDHSETRSPAVGVHIQVYIRERKRNESYSFIWKVPLFSVTKRFGDFLPHLNSAQKVTAKKKTSCEYPVSICKNQNHKKLKVKTEMSACTNCIFFTYITNTCFDPAHKPKFLKVLGGCVWGAVVTSRGWVKLWTSSTEDSSEKQGFPLHTALKQSAPLCAAEPDQFEPYQCLEHKFSELFLAKHSSQSHGFGHRGLSE